MKKIQVIIITLVIVLVLGCATFATLYFATDVFKSEKEMFYKYISKINVSEILDTNLYNNYQTRLESESYTNSGTIAINVQEDGENAFDETFEFNSQVDPVNKLASSTIDINKDGEKALTVNYLRNEDLYGIKFKNIVSQYIVLENNNLKELVAKFGIGDTINIPDKIDLSEMAQNTNQEDASLEELKSIFNKYINMIIENIPKENYSKVENGYKLTIDLKTLQSIGLKILDTLKNDEQVFNFVNSLISKVDSSQEISFEQYKNALEQGVEGFLEEIEKNYEIINIVVYKQGKIYAKIGLDSDEEKSYIEGTLEKNDNKAILKLNNVTETAYKNSEINLMISKNINITENDECNINIIAKQDGEEAVNANIIVARNGELDSSSIKNSLTANIVIPSKELEIGVEYNNDKTFDSNIEIEKFNDSNHAVINKYDYTQVNALITNLGNLISEKTDLGLIEIIGSAGIGLFSTSSMNLQNTPAIGVMLTGIVINVSLNSKLFEAAKNASEEATEQMIYEAIALIKADIMTESYYNDNLEISEQYIKEKIENYTGNKNIIVTKTAGKEEYIVTVSGRDLDTNKTRIDLSELQSN